MMKSIIITALVVVLNTAYVSASGWGEPPAPPPPKEWQVVRTGWEPPRQEWKPTIVRAGWEPPRQEWKPVVRKGWQPPQRKLVDYPFTVEIRKGWQPPPPKIRTGWPASAPRAWN